MMKESKVPSLLTTLVLIRIIMENLDRIVVYKRKSKAAGEKT